MKPNVLFLLIDTFRADKFFGKEKTSYTPNIDLLIKNGVYFDQAISCSDGTIFSWSGIFTGLHPFKTGIKSQGYKKINSNITSYFSILKNQGYNFYSYIPSLTDSLGIFPEWKNNDYSFDYYWNLSEGLGTKIINLLESKKMNEPWFYYIHVEDLHFPITLSKEFNNDKFGKSKYERKISAMDVWIGKILKKVNLKNTLVVITADHGAYIKAVNNANLKINLEVDGELQTHVRNLGNLIPKPLQPLKSKLFFFLERIRKKRKYQKIKDLELTPYEKRALLWQRSDVEHFLFDELVHVPLLFLGYNVKENTKVSQQVRIIDIFPTILDIIGIQNNNKDIDGQSLLPLIEGKQIPEEPAFMETHYLLEIESQDKIGIRTSQFKFFRDTNDPTKLVHLYDLKNDPFENNNIAKIKPDIAKKMEEILQEILQNSSPLPEDDEFDEEETKIIEDELKRLGYI
ncbi:sulfatase-like hydrolase/transferase [Marine Group I thaumarchaeote]|uniref:Sulfatase-like hydrolase/transferase n=1 Tax=Marine Group I thaumarchaeote TaxID=2511932 RepID=A0A7K4MKC5_9ARCH|nr:sulfatase-like hydrolase/transferase [Marine Group I thaumarchaeote]